jgi:capsular polysaccharide biosynthesis protein
MINDPTRTGEEQGLALTQTPLTQTEDDEVDHDHDGSDLVQIDRPPESHEEPRPGQGLATPQGVAPARPTWDLTPRPYESPGRSVRHHWRLAALVVSLTVLLALALGVVKKPVYSAESRLIVGKTVQLNNLAATPGLSVAGAELAVTYSRLLSTPAVLADAQKRAGAAGSGGSVSASPIPQSPIIRVEGTGTSAAMAAAQANAGAKALVKAVDDVNAAQKTLSNNLLEQYKKADASLINDTRDLADKQQQLATQPTNTLLRDQVTSAQTKVDSDTLALTNLGEQYKASATPAQVNEQIVQRLGTVTDAGNNRKTFLTMALLVALVVGSLLALGLAVLLDKRGARGQTRDGGPPRAAAG